MHKIKAERRVKLNNYMYPPTNNNYILLEELKKLNQTLKNIEKKLDEINPPKVKKYLEKDDNYYMI